MIWHGVAKRGPFMRETGDELEDHAGSNYPPTVQREWKEQAYIKG